MLTRISSLFAAALVLAGCAGKTVVDPGARQVLEGKTVSERADVLAPRVSAKAMLTAFDRYCLQHPGEGGDAAIRATKNGYKLLATRGDGTILYYHPRNLPVLGFAPEQFSDTDALVVCSIIGRDDQSVRVDLEDYAQKRTGVAPSTSAFFPGARVWSNRRPVASQIAVAVATEEAVGKILSITFAPD